MLMRRQSQAPEQSVDNGAYSSVFFTTSRPR